MVWVVTWLSVVVLNVDLGLAIGVVFSMMTVICRTQRYSFHFISADKHTQRFFSRQDSYSFIWDIALYICHEYIMNHNVSLLFKSFRAGCSVLGRASNTEIYRPLENHGKVSKVSNMNKWKVLKMGSYEMLLCHCSNNNNNNSPNLGDDALVISWNNDETFLFSLQCYEVPGVKILTYNGPIYYGNRSFFREEMSRLLGLTPEKIRSREKAQKALEKREREATVNTVVWLQQWTY